MKKRILQTKLSRIDRVAVSYGSLSLLLGVILIILDDFNFFKVSIWITTLFLFVSAVLFIFFFLYKVFFYRIYKGFRYMHMYRKIYKKLYQALFDANYYTEKYVFGKVCAVIPKIVITVADTLDSGIIYVENSIKLDKRLDELPISSGLPNHFVLTRAYISDNQNRYIYEFEKFTLEKLVFNSHVTFKQFCQNCSPYNLMIDPKYSIPMFHMLIVGQTGAGKSYALYHFILQMLSKDFPWDIYIIDPKYSGLYILGSIINKNQTAYTIDDSIALLEKFSAVMEERKTELNKLLYQKLDSDYRKFHLSPICLFIDEFSAFRSSLSRYDKKTRDRVDEIIGNIIREGRQLGCFCILAQQQTNAQNLPTELKENIPCKIILGNAERQTYMTALGCYPDIVKRNFKTGEGIFTYPELSTVEAPLVISIPTLDFDILEAVKTITINTQKGDELG